jgi:hypothetical protein
LRVADNRDPPVGASLSFFLPFLFLCHARSRATAIIAAPGRLLPLPVPPELAN